MSTDFSSSLLMLNIILRRPTTKLAPKLSGQLVLGGWEASVRNAVRFDAGVQLWVQFVDGVAAVVAGVVLTVVSE